MPLSPMRCFAVLLSLVPPVFFAGAAVAQAVAQAPGPPPGVSVSTAAEATDPPGRIGRLSELNGQVWLYHPGGGEWISAERNRPLTTGDRLATDAGARAEVRIGSTTLRLDAGSELEVLRLDDDRMAFQLHNGSVSARLRSRESVPEFEVTTGEGRFTAQRTGRYRFDRSDDTSFVTVYSGQATYEGPGSALKVDNGQRAEFWIDQANAAQYRLVAPVSDAFAGWNNERDRGDDRSASATRVSPEMTGVEDLDRYGRWEDTPEYGSVWYPRAVAPGWAPYSTGRWAWVQPWGWTWVDDAPWGFAPFHYGRWVYVRNNWCWSPGQYVRRPVYAPALVAWVGGPRLSVSVNIGGGPAVGWVPLAPREVFVPSYRVTPRYVREVNVTHVTQITNINTIVTNPQAAVGQRDFSNRKFPHAVTVVPASVLSSRQPVGPAASQWRNSPAVRQLANEPSRVSAVVAPQVSVPVAQPQPPRGQGFPLPPGRWRDANSRAEEPRAPSRAVQAAPAAPMPMPMAPQPGMAPAPTMPGVVASPSPGRDRQEPPRMRAQPMPGEGRREGPPTAVAQPAATPPAVQAPAQAPAQAQRPMPMPPSRAQPSMPTPAEMTHADRARAAVAGAEARRQSAMPAPVVPQAPRPAAPAVAPPPQPPAAVRQMERPRMPEMARPQMPRADRDGGPGPGGRGDGRDGRERQEGPRGERPARGPGSN